MSEPAQAPSSAPPPAPPSPPAIVGPEDFAPAIRWGVHTAIADGARCITAVDIAFGENWPWDDAALLSALAGWLRLPQRRLVLLAAGYDDFARLHPRFVVWRRDWSHAISPFVAPEELAGTLPTLLLDDRRLIRRRGIAHRQLGTAAKQQHGAGRASARAHASRSHGR